jgi:hypothetical protein
MRKPKSKKSKSIDPQLLMEQPGVLRKLEEDKRQLHSDLKRTMDIMRANHPGF